MSIPGNGIFVVRGELSTIMTAMRRTSKNSWNYQVSDERKINCKIFAGSCKDNA